MSTSPESQSTVCRNPATGEIIGHSDLTGTDELTNIFTAARRVFPEWSTMPLRRRIRAILPVRDYLNTHAEEIARTIAHDSGKTDVDAMATEVLASAMAVDFYAKRAAGYLREKKVSAGNILLCNKQPCLVRQPYGVIGIISPWNYPFAIPFSEVVMALLAGNTVVLKVASETQLVGRALERCFHAAGLPAGAFGYVNLPGREASRAMLEHGVDKLFFTGSVPVGKQLMREAADTLTPLVLELGGNDAMLVCPDADPGRAAEGAIWAGLQNCGQNCGGVERIYVHADIHDTFLSILGDGVRALRVAGDGPFSAELGVMATARQAEVVRAQVEQALAQGASVFAEARPQNESDTALPAQVLVDVDHSMDVMKEETFGPVLGVMKVDDMEQALHLANDTSYGLTASVWTRDRKQADQLARRLRAGAVMINDHLASHGMPGTPWGGSRDSGIGRTHGQAGFDEMTQVQVVIQDRLPFARRNIWWYPHGEQDYLGLAGAIRVLYGKGIGNRLRGFNRLLKLVPKMFVRSVDKAGR